MALAATGLALPCLAEEQKKVDFTPKGPMTIERRDYQGEALKAHQADDIRDAARRNPAQTQSLQQLLHQNELGGLPFPRELPPAGDGAPKQPDTDKTAAKPAN